MGWDRGSVPGEFMSTLAYMYAMGTGVEQLSVLRQFYMDLRRKEVILPPLIFMPLLKKINIKMNHLNVFLVLILTHVPCRLHIY